MVNFEPGSQHQEIISRERIARVFVLGIWAFMTIAAMGLVLRFGSPVPYVDDWAHIPTLCQGGLPSLSWLWTQQNEHRFPVTKALMWLSWQATGGDPRGGMALSVVFAAAACLALIRASRYLRGRSSYADAFFPFLLLHWGHAENFLWFIQLFFVTAASLVCGLISFLAVEPRRHSLVGILVASVCLPLVPLHGAMGLVFTLPLALGIAAHGVTLFRAGSASDRRRGAALLVSSAVALVLIGAYFIGYQSVSHHQPGQFNPLRVLPAAFRCATTGLGVVGMRGWPLSGVLVVGLTLVSVWVIVRNPRPGNGEWPQSFSLILALTAAWFLPIAIGVGRAAMGGGASRYMILATPLWACLFLIWSAYGRPALSQAIQISLFTLICSFSSYHASLGLELAKQRGLATSGLQSDIKDGIPLTGLVGRHAPYWCWAERPLAEGLESLRGAGVPFFAAIRPDPKLRSIPCPVEPSQVRHLQLHSGAWRGTDSSGALIYRLDGSRFVDAVRLRFTLDQDETELADFRVLWPHAGSEDPLLNYVITHHGLKLATGPKLRTQTIWVAQNIDHFEIRPAEYPFSIRIESIELLEPELGR
jgi:hypothetical protein